MRHTWRWAVALLGLWVGVRFPAAAIPPRLPPRPQTRPATLPALKGELAQKWRAYRAVWRTDDSKKLDAAEAALYSASGGRWQLESLSGEMERFYEAGEKSNADDGRLCRLAYIIFATRAKLFRLESEPRPPRTPDEKAVGRFIAEYQAARKRRARTALWGFRVVEAAAGNIPDPQRKDDAFGRAWHVMTPAAFFCMPFVDDPAPLLARMEKIKPKLIAAANSDAAQQANRLRQLESVEKMLRLFVRRSKDKQALAGVLKKYRRAYNSKDDDAFVKVCSAMDRYRKVPASRPADVKTLADVIAPAQWTIAMLRAYAIHVSDGTARIEAFIRYRDKAGKPGPIRQKTLHADKTAGRWRLR